MTPAAPIALSARETQWLERVPAGVRRVLHVDCGTGRWGAVLARRTGAVVIGTTDDEGTAVVARGLLSDVRVLDVERDPLPDGPFDAILCGDRLERVADPRALLRGLRARLVPGGTLLASVRTARSGPHVAALLGGAWPVPLDDPRLRYFTRREVEKLLYRGDFEDVRLEPLPGPPHAEWVAAGSPREVRTGQLTLRANSPQDAEEFHVEGYLVTALRPSADVAYPTTSIVMATHNQLRFTRSCLAALALRTDEPHETIVVDNGSTDGTPQWLRALGSVRVVENAENRGFPEAVNQGLEVATGECLLLLNNDTLPTTGWLRRMLDVLRRDPRVGLVGPCSNSVSGPQRIPVGYGDLAGLDGFAWDLARRCAGQVEETGRLVGFCLLVRRRVLEEVGLLDERFGIGNFEDDDLCRRARAAGWKAAIARDAFVHHFGGGTFRAAALDYGSLLDENRRRYEAKWSAPGPWRAERALGGGLLVVPHGGSFAPTPTSHATDSTGTATPTFRVTEPNPAPQPRDPHDLLFAPVASVARDPHGSPPSVPQVVPDSVSVGLSLCLIVRDNAGTIRPCLESIRPWVDELVVVDTGSTDETPRIAAELGARVEHRTWPDSFAAARNESLALARGRWIFWMDSDDTIPPECGRRLREIAAGPHDPDVLGYVMQVHCPGAEGNGAPDVTVVDHVKLFRNRPDLRFEHRIHEQILPAIRRAGGDVRFTDVFVVHSGADRTPEGKVRKLQRDFRLLELDLAERPDHPFVLFNLGMTCLDADRAAEAVRHLERCLAVSGPAESHVRKAYALLVAALVREGRSDDALSRCRTGLAAFPDDVELRFRSATLHQEAGRLAEAEAAYRDLLARPGERCFASVDAGLAGRKARHNLALVLERQGRFDEALAQWRAVVDEVPESDTAWQGLIECQLAAGRTEAARGTVETLRTRRAPDSPLVALLAARLASIAGDRTEARRLLTTAVHDAPDDPAPRRDLARLLFEAGEFDAAAEQLARLVELDPDDAAAWHNLAAARLESGRPRDALPAAQRSLALRPAHAPTMDLLETVRRAAH